MSIAANCLLCLYRYVVIFHRRHSPVKIITHTSSVIVLILGCAIINLPYLFTHKIVPGGAANPNSYGVVSGDLMKSKFGNQLVNTIAFARYFLLMPIFLIINIVLLFSSVKFARRKRDLLSNSRIRKDAVRRGSSNGTEASRLKENTLMLNALLVKTSPEKSTDEQQQETETTKRDSYEVSRTMSQNHGYRHNHNSSSSEWNLTKMTLFIALIYLANLLFLAISFVYPFFDNDNYTAVVVLDLIALNFVQITNLFEIISYFLFNRFFNRTFRRLAADFVKKISRRK